MKRLTIEQLLGIDKFVVDDEFAHIKVNKEICSRCQPKPCTFACPASLFSIKNGELSFDYAGCLECGTCRVVCPQRAGGDPMAIPSRRIRGPLPLRVRAIHRRGTENTEKKRPLMKNRKQTKT